MDVVKRLQNHNIKPSVQRIAIMNYLIEHRTHPTVDEIYTALSPSIPTLSKTTVYNTLKLLSEQGAAQTLTIDEPPGRQTPKRKTRTSGRQTAWRQAARQPESNA